MESYSPSEANDRLALLTASREQAYGRVLLPWRHVVGLALVMNGCLLTVVLPIMVSGSWNVIGQGVFVASGILLLLLQRRSQGVKRPKLHVRGAWVVSAAAAAGPGLALAVAIYASLHDSAALGLIALAINFAAYIVVFGGTGFFLRREVARVDG